MALMLSAYPRVRLSIIPNFSSIPRSPLKRSQLGVEKKLGTTA